MASEPDPAKRDEASAAVQDYLTEQAYVIPLFEEPQVYGAAPYVHGVDDRGGRPAAVLRRAWKSNQDWDDGIRAPPRRAGRDRPVAAFTATFVLLQVLPGDAILIKFESPELGLSPEQIADIRASYGADVPLVAAVPAHLLGFVQGDFGYSVQYGTPVHELIG